MLARALTYMMLFFLEFDPWGKFIGHVQPQWVEQWHLQKNCTQFWPLGHLWGQKESTWNLTSRGFCKKIVFDTYAEFLYVRKKFFGVLPLRDEQSQRCQPPTMPSSSTCSGKKMKEASSLALRLEATFVFVFLCVLASRKARQLRFTPASTRHAGRSRQQHGTTRQRKLCIASDPEAGSGSYAHSGAAVDAGYPLASTAELLQQLSKKVWQLT